MVAQLALSKKQTSLLSLSSFKKDKLDNVVLHRQNPLSDHRSPWPLYVNWNRTDLLGVGHTLTFINRISIVELHIKP